MADVQTVVDHLLLGRQALETEMDEHTSEIQRHTAAIDQLTVAMDQLDAVIGMVGPSGTGASGGRSAPLTRAEPSAVTVKAADRSAPRKAARSRKPRGGAPKSIRVHVLDMLAADDREWSLSEIIDRIHAAGIQAHDDAVRSITIKLMKDGRVERVGRGQYRLARRGSLRTASTATTVGAPAAEASTPDVDDADLSTTDEPVDVPLDAVPDQTEETVTDDAPSVVDDATDTSEAVTEPETVGPETIEPETVEPEEQESSDVPQDSSEARAYSPPLNLGQPWG